MQHYSREAARTMLLTWLSDSFFSPIGEREIPTTSAPTYTTNNPLTRTTVIPLISVAVVHQSEFIPPKPTNPPRSSPQFPLPPPYISRRATSSELSKSCAQPCLFAISARPLASKGI